ncbi:MAG: ATP-binding protein, partial [Methanococcaceae archaeon]
SNPDVVILDVKLPDISGFEVCKIMKENPALANIPVIHLSATYLDNDSRIEGLKGGADAYLTHPVEPRVLAATINAVLRIRQTEAKLYAAALKWQTTFDAINDGVCLVDADGIISQCNRSFTKITGLQQNIIAGKKLSKAIPEFEKFTLEYLTQLCKDNHTNEIEIISLNRGWYSVSVDFIEKNTQCFDGAVFKLSDITEKQKFEEKLQHTLSDLERSNKELEQFAFVASHDLQEPLRMVSSYIELLAKRYGGQFDENADQYIEFAVDGTKRMQMLIHDLLEYSRVTSKGSQFTEVNLENVMKNVESNLEVAIKGSNAEIIYEHLPVITADETQISQLFQNLISNAIKFRSNKDPQITIKSAEKNGELTIAICDNGIGIDPVSSQRIFEIFQRLHLRSEYPGTGIGLAVCKKIVERHHGRIWVESQPGAGSTFFFTIPRELKN